jgi:tetratricopeptide (TPR) repeat protein/DNA-binding CsgD family transcriptional regulator
MHQPSQPAKEISLSVLEARLKRAVRPKDRLGAMLHLAEELAHKEAVQTDRALLLFAQAERLAQSIGDRRSIASAVRGAGACQLRLSNLSTALELLERALPIAEQTGYAECEITILRDMGHVYVRQSRHDLALQTLRKCAELAELIENYYIQASVLDLMGILLFNLGRYHESLECHTKSLALLGDTEATRTDRAIILLNLSNTLQHLGKYMEALSALEQSIQLSIPGSRNEGLGQGSMGVFYAEMGDYPRALSSFFTSAKILERAGDKRNLAIAYGNLMQAHMQLGNIEQTANFGEKALAVFEEIGDKRGQAVMYINLGEYYLNQGQRVQAKQLMKQCLALSKETGSKDYEVTALIGLALLEVNHDKFITARKLYQNALDIASISGDRGRVVAALLGLGSLFLKWTKPDQALPYLDRAVIEKIHSRHSELEAHQMLAEALEATQDFKSALEHSKLASSIKEEILGAEKQKAIAELQRRSDIERSEHETELLRKETDSLSREIERMTVEIEQIAMAIAAKSELTQSLSRRIRKIATGSIPQSHGAGNASISRKFNELLSELDSDLSNGSNRTTFNNEFQLVREDILQKLITQHPSLTLMERKICVLLNDGLSNKQIAVMLKVSAHVIKKHRYEIRNKMKLEQKTSLTNVLAGI